MSSLYVAHIEAEVPLAAAGTEKYILGIKANANFGCVLKRVHVDIEGIVATEKPVRFRVYRCSFATNAPGTNSAPLTVVRYGGPLAATGWLAGKSWTTAPTVVDTAYVDEFTLDPNKGLYRYDEPMSDEADCALGEGFLLSALVQAADTVTGAISAAHFKFGRA